jgi:hypothetical protein
MLRLESTPPEAVQADMATSADPDQRLAAAAS